MAPKKKKREPEITVQKINAGRATLYMLGKTPLVFNSMSAKTKQGFLLPAPPKNRAQRITTLKHDPLEEYRDSPYRSKGDDGPTRIIFPSVGIKDALRSAAVDIAGATKAQIGRLTFIESVMTSIYGVPQMYMAVVRQAGITRAPDIRTRAIIPEWAAEVTFQYVTPQLTGDNVAALFGAAGMFIGIGDGRPEKGKMNFGQFEIVAPDHPDYVRILSTGGIAEQDAALESPGFYDLETEELYGWFVDAVQSRELKVVS